MRKKVLITGISRGLGKELFNLFAMKNYFVYGILRNKSDQEEFQKKFPENSKIILADLTSDKSIELMKKSIQDNPIDLLINNAGISGNSHLIQDVDSSEIIELFNIHCLGAFRTTKALSNNLIKAKNPMVLNLLNWAFKHT
ncbi:MAG: short-subunit dehydrogenase [Saprospiraceae bacterium]|jgi:short-subunit dehydrogenase